MIEYLPALQLAIIALKAAKDIIPQLIGHQDRCRALIERCEGLIVNACAKLPDGSPTMLDSQLNVVREACVSVQEITFTLSKMNPAWRVVKKEYINNEFNRCEAHLKDAFDTFNVGAQASHTRQQDELAQTLQQDRDVTFAYLDQLLKRSRALAKEIQAHPPIPPLHRMRERFQYQSEPVERQTQYYTAPITPASSSSWSIEAHELHDVEDSPVFTDGTVGKVLCKRFQKEVVAVKYLYEDVYGVLIQNKANKKRFQKKVLKWAQLVHPNICRFVGACFDIEGAFLVTEFCSNGNVMNYIRSFPEANLLSLLHQASKGVQHLHEIKIIHSNLKPTNILVHSDHRVVIHDHELARLKDDATMSGSASRHHIYGNWNYMAPEYLDGQADYPIDVYSFAMSAWQMYTGCVPFSKINWRQLRQHISCSRPERPGTMSDPLWVLLQRWWAGDPGRRPSFKDIEPSLRAFLEPDPARVLRQRRNVPGRLLIDPPPSPMAEVEPFHRNVNADVQPVLPQTPLRPSPAIKLSETSRTAISKIVYALMSPVSFERLAKEILGHYPYWLKNTPADFQVPHRVDHGLYAFQDTNTRSALNRFIVALKSWIENIPHFKDEVPDFDPRRTLLFVAAVIIMAEHSYVQKARSPHLHVDTFVRFSLARSDLRAFLEKGTRQIWAENQASGFHGVATVAADLVEVVEWGFDMLHTSNYSPAETR